ncbi:TPA: hypothetical protein JI101_16450 [Acinetobacter baumannii]|nr:hypothetical protein [Acinetobacter baumannii]
MLCIDLKTKIQGSDFAAAIEMPPKIHTLLSLELGVDFCDLMYFEGLPIVFIPSGEPNILNSDQFRMRKKYNEILTIYKEKYEEYINFINNKNKFVNGDFRAGVLLAELTRLSDRLVKIENQIKKITNF